MTRNLRTLTWKANLITAKKAKLDLLLRTNNTDVVAISESKLLPKYKFSIPGYKVYRSNRNQFGGGVMLLINAHLCHDMFTLPPLTGLEAIAVCLHLQNRNTLLFVAAYHPPAVTIARTDLDAIFSQHDAVIVAGDLNCKHPASNNSTVNRNGHALLSYCFHHSIAINYLDPPTHFPYSLYPSVLDIALSHRSTTSKPKSIPALSSDHNPIVFKVHLHPTATTPRLLYDYKHADWPLFRASIDRALDPTPVIHNTVDLDQAIAIFTHAIRQAATSAIPVHSHHNRLTFPPSLVYLWRLKNYYRRRYQ
jgi:hypothetical protein